MSEPQAPPAYDCFGCGKPVEAPMAVMSMVEKHGSQWGIVSHPECAAKAVENALK